MSTLLKDVYSLSFYESFAKILAQTIPSFNEQNFNQKIFCSEFETYELKQRMNHTAEVLHDFLSPDFETAAAEIIEIITLLKKSDMKGMGFEFMFFPEYISMYGLNDFKSSVSAMECITQFTSCEFAVRPFFLKHEDKMLNQMLAWSQHENYGVRRLSSEGSRPRLPWGMGVPSLKKDPSPILPILENLKSDPSETVRRSVANNLNDISKDHPAIVKKITKNWMGKNAKTDAILKHGCRTLLKQGDTEILKRFGFDSSRIELSEFTINTPHVKLGDKLEFSFSVENRDNKKRNVRLEYALYYLKKNGELSKKIFKISERGYEPGSKFEINRKQSFRKITTRTFYTGEHKLSVIINGRESESKKFELIP